MNKKYCKWTIDSMKKRCKRNIGWITVPKRRVPVVLCAIHYSANKAVGIKSVCAGLVLT